MDIERDEEHAVAHKVNAPLPSVPNQVSGHGMELSPLATVLLVEDESTLLATIAYSLRREGHRVLTAADGEQALELASLPDSPDVIVLDVMLPRLDGFEVCRRIRRQSAVPILMLTAKTDEVDRIVGLELGADDYLTKPFNPRELLARIKAVLRRSQESAGKLSKNEGDEDTIKFQFDNWVLDKAIRKLISPDEMEVNLSAGAYDLLLTFLTHPKRVLTRDQLLDMAKNRAGIPYDRSIDVQVSRLRQKLEVDPKNPIMIKTVRGGGY